MLFTSTHESGVDAKRRVSIPADFRKSLAGEDSVFIWPSVNKDCLEGGGERLVLKLRRAIYRMAGEEREAFQMRILGKGRFCRLDEGGRIVLDPDLLAHAKLSDKATFIGIGDRFQLWSPSQLAERESRFDAIARENAAKLDSLEEDDLDEEPAPRRRAQQDDRRGFE